MASKGSILEDLYTDGGGFDEERAGDVRAERQMPRTATACHPVVCGVPSQSVTKSILTIYQKKFLKYALGPLK